MNHQPMNPAIAESPAPPPGALVSGYKRPLYSYSCLRSSGTKDWLAMFTLSGEGSVRHHGHRHFCRAGDLVVLPPGIPHDYSTTETNNWEMMWVHFIPKPEWASWLHLPKVEKGLLFLHISDPAIRRRVRLAFEGLISDNLVVTNPLRHELELNSLKQILLLASSQSSKQSTRVLDPRIHDVLNLLSQNIGEAVSIGQLAQKACLSTSRLIHLFKEQTGDSIFETLLKMRLRQAAKLLEFTSLRITEIAADVGFQTPDYFARKFAQYYGLTPSAYRKKPVNDRASEALFFEGYMTRTRGDSPGGVLK